MVTNTPSAHYIAKTVAMTTINVLTTLEQLWAHICQNDKSIGTYGTIVDTYSPYIGTKYVCLFSPIIANGSVSNIC